VPVPAWIRSARAVLEWHRLKIDRVGMTSLWLILPHFVEVKAIGPKPTGIAPFPHDSNGCMCLYCKQQLFSVKVKLDTPAEMGGSILCQYSSLKRYNFTANKKRSEMKFVNFNEQNIEPTEKPFDQNNVIEGNPVQHVWNHFAGASDKFKSGMWDCSTGVFVGPMNNQIEYCHILEGEARIETPDGKSRTVRAGDSFVMDNGLQPVWHVEKYVRKYYVIGVVD